MKFESHSENPNLTFVKRYFDQDSIVRNESGQVTEIRLPEIEGEEAMSLVRSLEKIGVVLTVTSYNDGVLELALTQPDAVAKVMSSVIESHVPHGQDSSEALEASPEIVSSEWSTQELEEITEHQELSSKDVTTGFEDSYTEDALDLIEQGAVRFYQGREESDVDDVVKAHNPRFATDRRFFPQNYEWDEGQLYNKNGNPVSIEEHRQILEDAKNSDEALATACQIHEGLVRWVANRQKPGFSKSADYLIDMDDLLQAGREGLIKAIKKLELPEDDSKAVNTTYLIEYIKGGMFAAVYGDKGGMVLKPPVNVHHTDFKAFRTDQRRQKEDHEFNEPDLTELRENTNFDIKKVRDLYQVINQLPEEYDDQNPEHQHDHYRPDYNLHEEAVEFGDQFENFTDQELKEVVNKVLGTLPPRHERVIRLRFFFGKTLEEIGQEFGVTTNRIGQIEAKGLRLLKHPSRSRRLRSFLDD